MTFWKISLAGIFAVLGIYLFVTAPPPMAASGGGASSQKTIEIAKVFHTINQINAATRAIYTSDIVGKGLKEGLAFSEDWRKPEVDAGPLPALLLRTIAEKLQTKTPRIGLFLGSDQPIVPSNLFTGLQATKFEVLKQSNAPQIYAMPDGSQVAMFPDPASAAPCVSCHNDHKNSPKKDWKLNDIMGATTWTFKNDKVSVDEYRMIISVLYASIGEGYEEFLTKARGYKNPPIIGSEWPAPGKRVIPDGKTMMQAVYAATGGPALADLVNVADAGKAGAKP